MSLPEDYPEDVISDETIEACVILAVQAEEMAKLLNTSIPEGMRVVMKTFQAGQKVSREVRDANAKVGRAPVEIKQAETMKPEDKPNVLRLLDFKASK